MTKDQPASMKDARVVREARLATQLRENLKRRKSQVRARTNSGISGKVHERNGSETGQTSCLALLTGESQGDNGS